MINYYPKNKTLVFHLGSEAGFFSEYNNMILGLLYCMKNGINFKLYSKDANFALEKGWTDFFEPFCIEVDDKEHHEYNNRQISPLPKMRLKHPTSIGRNLLGKFRMYNHKRSQHFDYYTFELWNEIHNRNLENQVFNIANELKDCLLACKSIVELTWKYNEKTQKEVLSFISSLNLPLKYLSVHIRRGDKTEEINQFSIEKYMQMIQNNSQVKDVFVLTDDYGVILELSDLYPNYNFYTLCNPSERGYVNTQFVLCNTEEKREKLCKLFASMDVMAKSELFVGTYSSNPGMCLGMRMQKDKIKCVDYDNWLIW